MKGIGRTVKRRRREAKTDYHARLRLIKGTQARVVVRKTNRYIIAELVTSDIAQDKVIAGVSSKDLLAQGWPTSLAGSLKSIPAAYLTGLLLAQKASEKQGVLDIGMQRNVKKGRLYAVVAGLVAGGFSIAHNPEIIPDEKRLVENTRTREIFMKLKEKLAHGRTRNKE